MIAVYLFLHEATLRRVRGFGYPHPLPWGSRLTRRRKAYAHSLGLLGNSEKWFLKLNLTQSDCWILLNINLNNQHFVFVQKKPSDSILYQRWWSNILLWKRGLKWLKMLLFKEWCFEIWILLNKQNCSAAKQNLTILLKLKWKSVEIKSFLSCFHNMLLVFSYFNHAELKIDLICGN